MNKRMTPILILALLSISTLGCSTEQKLLPKNDETLIYQLPYDLTFLRTVEALEQHRDWELEETEKEKGIIVVRNLAHSHLEDADKRRIIFNIRRISSEKTSISIDPNCQYVLGGSELLKLITKYLSNEL